MCMEGAVRHNQFMISRKDVCGWAVGVLHQALSVLEGVSPATKVSPRLLIEVLVRLAADRRSLDAIARLLPGLPCADTLRRFLYRWLPRGPMQLDPVIRAALHWRLPKALSGRPRTMAIDLHTKPYYGDRATPGIYRGQRKASTKTFFAYATLLVIRKGCTFTVGLVPVCNNKDWPGVIEQLLAQAASRGLQPRCLLLDRGFYAAKVMQYLQARHIPYVMPMIRRGKKAATKKECTGTAQFFVKRRRGWARYAWKARIRTPEGKQGRRTPVRTDVCMVPKEKGGTPWVFACYRMRAYHPKEIAKLYRRRFRIETSYRQMREGLGLTTSKHPVYRLLLVLIALVLRNLWVWLHWTRLAIRGDDGKRMPRLERLRLRTMLQWIVQTIDLARRTPKCITIANPHAAAA